MRLKDIKLENFDINVNPLEALDEAMAAEAEEARENVEEETLEAFSRNIAREVKTIEDEKAKLSEERTEELQRVIQETH